MRLINALTLELEEFDDSRLSNTPYAILSHTWADDEVSFQDMQDLSVARTKKGFAKIEATCHMAVEVQIKYAWVDTCCIDKTSSAELSEAINSMFRWYENALVCFAYLFDVSERIHSQTDSTEFRDCRWFMRGWCLQELIAPRELLFFDKHWGLIGSRGRLAAEVEEITGIPQNVIDKSVPLSSISLARRMSWASKRQTSRIEDRAYSLLGIFEVNMPLIYGEGSRAFVRLQEEILKNTSDLSLLAWQTDSTSSKHGVLAESPDGFRMAGKIVLRDDQFRFRDEIAMTNKGLKLNIALQHLPDDKWLLDLHCNQVEADGKETRIGIYLVRQMDMYFRYLPYCIVRSLSIPQRLPAPIFLGLTKNLAEPAYTTSADKDRRIYIHFPKSNSEIWVGDITAVPEAFWHDEERYFSMYHLNDFKCFVRFRLTPQWVSAFPSSGQTTKESGTQFILGLKMTDRTTLGMFLYSETDFKNSALLDGFIDPFTNIVKYGSFGDLFSLSVLLSGDGSMDSVSQTVSLERGNFRISSDLRRNASGPRIPLVVSLSVERLGERPKTISQRIFGS